MAAGYAEEFAGIPAALAANESLRESMLRLIAKEPVAGKVTEGGGRLESLRGILADIAGGKLSVQQGIERVESALPRETSGHGGDNRVFSNGWAERLARTQFSRFYSQTVLEKLKHDGEAECFVPRSTEAKPDSQCSRVLAGRVQSVNDLHARIVREYGQGAFTNEPKIPDHPHCTHVVSPKP